MTWVRSRYNSYCRKERPVPLCLWRTHAPWWWRRLRLRRWWYWMAVVLVLAMARSSCVDAMPGYTGADRDVNCVLRLRQSCTKRAGGLLFIHVPDGGQLTPKAHLTVS